MKFVAPSVDSTAFNCPHCSVLTSQVWFGLHADRLEGKPFLIHAANMSEFSYDHVESKELRKDFQQWAAEYAKGAIKLNDTGKHVRFDVENLHFSQCRECQEVTVWKHDEILYPKTNDAPPVNPDTPSDVKEYYAEAAAIFGISSRGSAALLRLAIQALLVELGGRGKDINDDIARLSKNGIDSTVIQALDILRVVGNNAVHPGQIDFKDDRGIAMSLFLLFNMIVDKTISEQKRLNELYDMLPEGARLAIDRRNSQ